MEQLKELCGLGFLSLDLDILPRLKNLSEESNPVVFYYEYKN